MSIFHHNVRIDNELTNSRSLSEILNIINSKNNWYNFNAINFSTALSCLAEKFMGAEQSIKRSLRHCLVGDYCQEFLKKFETLAKDFDSQQLINILHALAKLGVNHYVVDYYNPYTISFVTRYFTYPR